MIHIGVIVRFVVTMAIAGIIVNIAYIKLINAHEKMKETTYMGCMASIIIAFVLIGSSVLFMRPAKPYEVLNEKEYWRSIDISSNYLGYVVVYNPETGEEKEVTDKVWRDYQYNSIIAQTVE